RRQFLGVAGATVLAAPLARATGALAAPGDVSVALLWNDAALQGVRTSTLGPPMVARALAIVHTCIYDAWAAYDGQAAGTQLGRSPRRPAGARPLATRNAAVSFAAYRAAVALFPASRQSVFDPLMQRLGYDPRDGALDFSPAGIGNLVADAILRARHRDGA